MWKPELLAPAKNLERLKVAIAYGADAVYLGGQAYGLRARADNFTQTELAQAVTFAHAHNAKVYVTLNAFLHDADFVGLDQYCQFLEAIGVDAVIVSDLGVIRAVQRSSSVPVHLSTQASCLNQYAAQIWQKVGIQRLIVGRELGIAEAGQIQTQTQLEVEMFTHGAMCMSYSGHCTISNYTAGRDSNRGGCIQSCRSPYSLTQASATAAIAPASDDHQVAFMSSQDLWGIHQIPAFFQQHICSLKVEGRMKSSFYVAIVCKVYRRLIDAYADGSWCPELLEWAAQELQSMPHRDYFAGSLETPAGPDSIYQKSANANVGTHQYVGIVVDSTADDLVVRLAEPLETGQEIEVIPFEGEPVRWQVTQLFSVLGEPRAMMRQDSVVRLPKATMPLRSRSLAKLNIVRLAQPAPLMAHAI